MKNNLLLILLLFPIISLGCVNLDRNKPEDSMIEPQWIRNGEPVIFEEQAWYPKDIVENLKDEEMIYIYTFNQEKVYIEKKEVRPYNRLYTKFGKYQYRLFEKND